jgi:hypothetical protein
MPTIAVCNPIDTVVFEYVRRASDLHDANVKEEDLENAVAARSRTAPKTSNMQGMPRILLCEGRCTSRAA